MAIFKNTKSFSASTKGKFAAVAWMMVAGILGAMVQDSHAQKRPSTPWEDTYPLQGKDSVWHCLRHDGWTEAQRQLLAESAWQVKIHVDTTGRAKVVEVLGVSDEDIEQKLLEKSCLGPFMPRMLDGQALPAFYFLYHSARDQVKQWKEGPEAYEKFKMHVGMDDIDEVTYRSMGIDFYGGAYVPVFAGTAAPYLSPGVGGSFGLGIRFREHYTFSAAISYAAHWVAREIPETKDTSVGSSAGNFGAIFLLSRDIKMVTLSALGGLAELGIAPADGDRSPRDEGSLYGLTSGMRLGMPVWTFVDKIGFKHGGAFRQTTSLDVTAGVRYNYFEYTNMRGWMVEAGINYRWRIKDIDSMRMRNAYYDL